MKTLRVNEIKTEPLVHVIDDDDSLRNALSSLLRSVGIQTRTYPSAEDLLSEQLPDVPSCLVLDVRLQGISGLDLQARLTDCRDKLPIIFMTGHGDIAMTVRAMKAGAVDFLPKPVREQDLLDAVSVALANSRMYRESSLTHARLIEKYQSLTSREKEIMRLAVNGVMNKNIAAELNLREITIKIHRRSAMNKMEARTFAELVKMGNDLNLLNGYTRV
jgi:FixJ family two-component response regulator